MAYLYDCHVHTSETSWCGMISAAEMVRLYAQAGYTGIVITDHYFQQYFESLPQKLWEEKIAVFLEGYRAAYAEGQARGLEVLLGVELRFHNRIEDYLVYGITPEFLVDHPVCMNTLWSRSSSSAGTITCLWCRPIHLGPARRPRAQPTSMGWKSTMAILATTAAIILPLTSRAAIT